MEVKDKDGSLPDECDVATVEKEEWCYVVIRYRTPEIAIMYFTEETTRKYAEYMFEYYCIEYDTKEASKSAPRVVTLSEYFEDYTEMPKDW